MGWQTTPLPHGSSFSVTSQSTTTVFEGNTGVTHTAFSDSSDSLTPSYSELLYDDLTYDDPQATYDFKLGGITKVISSVWTSGGNAGSSWVKV